MSTREGMSDEAGERGLLERIRAGDREAAEVLVEQTYEAVFAGLVRLCGGDRDLNHVRRPLRAVPLEDDGVPVPVDPAPSPEESLGTGETFLRLRRAVFTLPEDLRFAVTARFWGGLSVAEIAKEEGLTTVAIRKRLRRAMNALETALQGVTP